MSGKASKRARQQAKGTVGRSTRHPAPLTYWHGGMPGLKPGDHLLPMTTLLGLPARARLRNEVLADVDMSWVAMSTDRDLAEGFAERWSYQLFQRYRSQLANAPDPWHQAAGLKGGSLYRVEPRGATSPDPDLPEVSLRARRAVIVALWRSSVSPTPHRSGSPGCAGCSGTTVPRCAPRTVTRTPAPSRWSSA